MIHPYFPDRVSVVKRDGSRTDWLRAAVQASNGIVELSATAPPVEAGDRLVRACLGGHTEVYRVDGWELRASGAIPGLGTRTHYRVQVTREQA